MNKERLVFEVVEGVSTPEEGKEIVSRAARLMALSPDYSIRHAFDFDEQRKVGIRDSRWSYDS